MDLSMFKASALLGVWVLAGCVSTSVSRPHAREYEISDRGHAQLRAGDLVAARQTFTQLTSTDLDPAIRGLGFLGLGRVERASGNPQEALQLLRSAEIALEGHPEYPDVLIALGETHIDLHALSIARGQLEKAFNYLHPGPSREHAARLLSLLYEEAGLSEDAQRYLIWSQNAALADYSEWEKKIEPVIAQPPPRVVDPVTPARPKPVLTIQRREQWSARPTRRNVQAMGSIEAITIHHTGEAAPPRLASDAMVRAYLQKLQRYVQDEKRWADIGYHYLIDSRGKVWEGRALRHQGAHAGNPSLNKGNVGIALIGNFDLERPTGAQIESMRLLVEDLARTHQIPVSRICTHRQCREKGGLGMTDCPGVHLERWVKRMIDSLAAAR